MPDSPPIEPSFDVQVPAHEYLGRGPACSGASFGWSRAADIFYRCAQCASLVAATQSKNYSCSCGAMVVDADYQRFGSNHGDRNILVYRRTSAQ